MKTRLLAFLYFLIWCHYKRITIGCITLLLSAFVSSCYSQPAQDKLLRAKLVNAISAIQQRPVGDTITLDMAAIAKFKWDTLYVFPGFASLAMISESIGTTWLGTQVGEDDNLFVFMEKGEVKTSIFIEGRFNTRNEPSYIYFIGHANSGELFTPATAKFLVVRDKQPPNFIRVFFGFHQESIRRPGYDAKHIALPTEYTTPYNS